MNPLIKTTLLRTFVFSVLASLSTWLFVYVEHTEEDNEKEKMKLLLSLYESMASKYNMTISEFNNFSSVAYEALSEPKPQWTYLHATDFVFQAFSTIGYGWITPQTPTGQILCIFVSIVGIPITLLTLKSVGELITNLVNAAVTKFENKILKRVEPKQVQSKSAVILVALMVLTMIANGFVMRHLAGWTFIESVYYWFITFTTIGFGDYVYWQSQSRIKQLSFDSLGKLVNKDADPKEGTFEVVQRKLVLLYSLAGLCLVASALNSIMAAIEERRCRPRCSGCVPRKTQNYPDDNSIEQHELDETCLNVENTELRRGKYMGTLSVTEIK